MNADPNARMLVEVEGKCGGALANWWRLMGGRWVPETADSLSKSAIIEKRRKKKKERDGACDPKMTAGEQRKEVD